MTAQTIFDVSGRVAFVTGAATGLGRAMARALARGQSRVACFDMDQDKLAITVSELREAGADVLDFCADVTDAEAVQRAVDKTVTHFGALDIAVANAGVSDASAKPLHQTQPQEIERVLDVNLGGVLNVNRAVLGHMVAQERGKIINVASMWGLAAPAGLFPRPGYAASKGAVVNLTRELALEYAPHNIQINALCPGFFRTETRPRDTDHAKIMTDYTPLGRIAEADEIAGSLLYLASSASDFVTGTMLVVDGGVLAR